MSIDQEQREITSDQAPDDRETWPLKIEYITVEQAVAETHVVDWGTNDIAKIFRSCIEHSRATRIVFGTPEDAVKKINLAYTTIRRRPDEYKGKIELRRTGNILYVIPIIK